MVVVVTVVIYYTRGCYLLHTRLLFTTHTVVIYYTYGCYLLHIPVEALNGGFEVDVWQHNLVRHRPDEENQRKGYLD